MATQLWGCVNTDGTIYSGSKGANGTYNFVISKVGAGNYEIEYDSPFSVPPAVVLTQNFQNWNDFAYSGGYLTDNAILIAGNEKKCKVLTGANQSHVDRNFTFIAIGE